MKKLILFASALAGLFLAASCQQENLEPVVKGGVTYEISLPEKMQTKGETGYTTYDLYYEVYKTVNATELAALTEPLFENKVTMNGNTHTLTLDLLNDQDYTVLFWANKEGVDYFNLGDLRNVVIKQATSNNDDRDAFCGIDQLDQHDGAQTKTVELKRPFAQVNIATLVNDVDYDIDPKSSLVKFTKVPVAFNVFTGEPVADTEAVVTFDVNTVPTGYMNVNGTDYKKVAMNYVFVPEGTVDVSYEINTINGTVKNSIPNVPVKKNYRTNIIGNLLTSNATYNIVLLPGFEEEEIIIDFKDEIPATIDLGEGNTVNLPALSADYTVKVSGEGVLELDGTTIASASGAAIEIAENADVTLVIKNNVTVTGAAEGILVPENATLTILGSGTPIVKSGVTENKLTVIGNAGSGIAGSVVIEGLSHITAKGNGDHAYGIGGSGANVLIKNSTVDYVCGGHIQPLCINDPKYGKSEPEGGAAIGGAFVKIEGSVVTKADGGSKAAAIGESYWQSTEIEIINSTIVEANGGNASAGIGGSRYAGEAKHNVSVKIQNSNVTATGGQFGAGIGSGYDTHCNGQEYEAVNYIEIDAASVINAKGGKYAAGIGTGFHAAYLTGSIAAGAQVTAEAGDETFYKDAYTTAQNIGYGIVDPAREFSGANAEVTFTVAGDVVEYPLPYVETEDGLDIYAAEGLVYFAQEVNKFSNYERPYEGKTVKLMNDIDLKGMEWTPIGDYRFSANRFCGTFDGQGHTVSNFQITKKTDKNDSNKSAYGFFGNVEGTVKNLTIANATVSSYAYTAALAGRLNSGLIENCHVVNCTVSNSYWQGGILVGQVNGENNHPVVRNCSVTNSSITSKSAVGAISGPVTTTKEGSATFENCVVEGCQVVQNGSFGGSYDNYFGSLFGYLEAEDNAPIMILNYRVENTTVKGEMNAPISGDFDGQIYVDGCTVVTTEAQLESTLKAGGNIALVNNIALTKSLAISNADFVLDGNGYTISQAGECTNTYALFDITGGKAEIKNVTFDGVKEGAVVRTVGVEFTADNVTAINGAHTQQQGLFRLMGKSTITNCNFKNNTCNMVITLNYDGANNDPQVVDNCVFEGNTCNATAVLYYVKGAGATINGNKFVGNTVNCNSNGATVYMGFTENNVITNNLFQNNTVNEASTSKRVAGGLMLGYEAIVTGNAFIGNTVTGTNAKGNDVCASVYYTDIDLSGNYWGGNAPVENDDYFVEYPNNNKVIINDYLTANPFN